MKDIVYFAKVKPNAIIPSKRAEDGCYDIYACFDEDYIVIEPNSIATISTGIASCFESKYRFDLSRERGSTGSKGMAIRCGQIDSGYRGEWFVKMNNTWNMPVIIAKKDIRDTNEFLCKMGFKYGKYEVYPYEKAICQAALEFVPDVEIDEKSFDELLAIPSERMLGCLGSSNK